MAEGGVTVTHPSSVDLTSIFRSGVKWNKFEGCTCKSCLSAHDKLICIHFLNHNKREITL